MRPAAVRVDVLHGGNGTPIGCLWEHFLKFQQLYRSSFRYLRESGLPYARRATKPRPDVLSAQTNSWCRLFCLLQLVPIASTEKHDGCVDIPPLPNGTILLVEVGSTAHGTGLPGGEDQDETAIVIESPRQVLGLDPGGPATIMQRTQPEGMKSGPGDTDRTLHPLRRFLYLASTGNPSVLMSLWSPVLEATAEGLELRGLGDLFVGRHVIPRYRGYMQSQAVRLLGIGGARHGRRGGEPREHLNKAVGYDTKYAMHCARLGFQGLELLRTGHLIFPIQGEPAEWLLAVRRGEVAFEEWWSRSLELDAELEALAEDDSIPPEPDRAAIEEWSVATHLEFWRGQS